MSKDFQFDAQAHRYSIGRQRIPSVTGILRSCGLSRDLSTVHPAVLEHKRKLGLALDAALRLLIEDDLDRTTVDPGIALSIAAFEQFQKDTGFESEGVGGPQIGEIAALRYGLTLDVRGLWRGKPAIVDFKMIEGKPDPAWGIQTAGYALGLDPPLVAPFKYLRFSLQLPGSGKYDFHEWKDPSDYDMFRWGLSMTWGKINRRMEAGL